jgi:hypothetical protein
MKFLRKLIKSIILALYWHKAMNAVYREDYKKALDTLRFSESYVEHTFGNYLLKGWVLFKLNSFDESIQSMTIAIEKLLNAKSLNEDEKSYLEYYAALIINTSIDHSSIDCRKRVLNMNFDFKNVSDWHKNNFPIPK